MDPLKRKEAIRVALLVTQERTTLGVVGQFGCPSCDRYLPDSFCAGGVWAAGEHVMVCRDCSDGKFPAE